MAHYTYVGYENEVVFENTRANIAGAKQYAITLIKRYGFRKVEIYNSTRTPRWIGTIWARKDNYYTYETNSPESTLLDKNGNKAKIPARRY